MSIRIGDVRAKDHGIKKRTRRLLALVGLELLSRSLEHACEERFSRTTARAIEYQDPFVPPPTVSVSFRPLR